MELGFKTVELKLPTDYSDEDLKIAISKKLGIRKFSHSTDKKSLDARNKRNIHWIVRASVSSPEIRGGEKPIREQLHIPKSSKKPTVAVVGSGPAGFFAAWVLLKGGAKVTLFEQGPDVEHRAKAISEFEKSGKLTPRANYAFGEGGAGTFSDGKLTSRTKSISKERDFIYSTFIEGGAPEEIAYLAFPHLGSDNLIKIVRNLRGKFITGGGDIRFDTKVTDVEIKGSRITALVTEDETFPCDQAVFAPGHSSYETYRMLMKRGLLSAIKTSQ